MRAALMLRHRMLFSFFFVVPHANALTTCPVVHVPVLAELETTSSCPSIACPSFFVIPNADDVSRSFLHFLRACSLTTRSHHRRPPYAGPHSYSHYWCLITCLQRRLVVIFHEVERYRGV
ncbi:hypothetical protein C8J57DRAFT_1409449 [Mycena rebaudengoi]|nr:hypothetical protein C8J57DRAFT_1409449 [Mycena rebaudengoi]